MLRQYVHHLEAQKRGMLSLTVSALIFVPFQTQSLLLRWKPWPHSPCWTSGEPSSFAGPEWPFCTGPPSGPSGSRNLTHAHTGHVGPRGQGKVWYLSNTGQHLPPPSNIWPARLVLGKTQEKREKQRKYEWASLCSMSGCKVSGAIPNGNIEQDYIYIWQTL